MNSMRKSPFATECNEMERNVTTICEIFVEIVVSIVTTVVLNDDSAPRSTMRVAEAVQGRSEAFSSSGVAFCSQFNEWRET
jgi:hypothetical protein